MQHIKSVSIAALLGMFSANAAHADCVVREGQRKELKGTAGGEWKVGALTIDRVTKSERAGLLCRIVSVDDPSSGPAILVTVTDSAGTELADEGLKFPHMPLPNNFADGTINVRIVWRPNGKMTGFCVVKYCGPKVVEAEGEAED